MTRFWSRFVQPFHHKKNNNKLPVLVFNEYIATSNNHLKGSHIYGKHLVSTERLSRAYDMYLKHHYRHKRTSRGSSSWRYMDPFIQIWYSEFQKINQQVQVAEDILDTQLSELYRKLISISSPIKSHNPKSLKRVYQFVSTFLKEYSFNPSEVIQDTKPTSLNELAFQSYYENLASKITKELEDQDAEPVLTDCICNIYRFEQALILHHHYIYSQLYLLKDIYQSALSSTIDEDNLTHITVLARWRQKYNAHNTQLQNLYHRFHAQLSRSIPTKPDATCAICLSLLKDPTTLNSCHHTFCKSCIQRVYCPICYSNKQQFHFLPKACSCLSRATSYCPLCRTPFDSLNCTTKRISHYFRQRSFKLTDIITQDPTIFSMARKSWII